jgi:hypothetical protein
MIKNSAMDKETSEKVNRILAFIEKDRMVQANPFFSTRVMAEAAAYFASRERKSGISRWVGQLKPVLAAAAIITGIFAGIFSGTRLIGVNSSRPDLDRSARVEQLAKESFIDVINNPVEEQILSK